ncbi:hypothetical protein CMI41_00245 [Candidatus Pacearchaeota archaeon]|nr:hypothetical protein [Candidatus Pacearchaeota archaeon]|tara:strand:- start:1795 stop:2127 length:333 start_codon:yes stop_codon:yes gene_type:complete
MVNEARVSEITEGGVEITLGEMLREFRRTASFFARREDKEWEELSEDFMLAADNEYHFGIRWRHSPESPISPDICSSSVSHDSTVSSDILEKYIRCNVYCSECIMAMSGK